MSIGTSVSSAYQPNKDTIATTADLPTTYKCRLANRSHYCKATAAANRPHPNPLPKGKGDAKGQPRVRATVFATPVSLPPPPRRAILMGERPAYRPPPQYPALEVRPKCARSPKRLV